MNMTIWIFVLGAIVILATIVQSLMHPLSGVWQRMDITSPRAARERITLSQFWIFVLGKRIVVGGHQSFFGIALGQNLWMRRRDFGIVFLSHEGFPENIASQIEGQILAKYRLQLSEDQFFISGDFVPYQVEFTANPPIITGIQPQTPVARKYRRIESILDAEIAVASPTAK